ncbi:MAG: WbqC family protein [Prolixibacteraceae bacterium]|jgi:hypothetical protein|nr:WbqC family protein [Prolixibacteraceae bacterium]
MNKLLLSTAYLAPVQYYSKIAVAKQVHIEHYDSYKKQTYRNRCRILGGNGPYDLIIPVVKNSGVKTMVKDTQIEYLTRWQDKHWRTIVSAYNSSPFFEYYRDDFQPFFEKKWKYLFDFNSSLHELLMDLLELDAECKPTDDFIREFEGVDLRSVILPRKEELDKQFHAKPYTQTFNDRFGFVPNLSVLDLLFNVGPESGSVLEESFKL